jgi:3-oxoacyl-[acyl-carrier protein] reductase
MKLSGKRALVTGGASGLGAAIALAFAREGARVLLADLDQKKADGVADRCSTLTPGSSAVHCDVSDSGSVAKAFDEADRRLGTLDILVNNAGIVHGDPAYRARISAVPKAQLAEALGGEGIKTHWEEIERLTDEMFDRMMKVHVYGTFYCTREALRRMRVRGEGGRIVNLGSIMGTASLTGAPDYCAAKGAILAFTRATAREAASYGVLVNAIAPGYIDTPMLDILDEEMRQLLRAQTPLGRIGRPEDIAAAALYLAGPDSAFVTGQTLSPNGGVYMSQ